MDIDARKLAEFVESRESWLEVAVVESIAGHGSYDIVLRLDGGYRLEDAGRVAPDYVRRLQAVGVDAVLGASHDW